jgi:hypothetical protein
MNNFLDLNFTQQDLNDAQKDEYAIIPKGEYMAEITRSEIKDFHWQNSGAVGKSLSLMFKIVEGEYAGRVIWDNPQLSNSEFDGFVKDGRKRLAQIAAATGITQLNDSQQLHDIPMTVVLGIEVDKNGVYDDKNVIKKVLPLKGGAPSKFTAKPQVPSQPAAPAAPAAPEQPQADAAPSWQRG